MQVLCYAQSQKGMRIGMDCFYYVLVDPIVLADAIVDINSQFFRSTAPLTLIDAFVIKFEALKTLKLDL